MRPYFRIRPALCAQTRLYSKISRQSSAQINHNQSGLGFEFHIPLTAALTVGAGARVEDRLVRHVGLGVVKLFVDEVVGKGTAAAGW